MSVVFLVVTGIHGLVSLASFRMGFYLFIFLYGIYPRFLAVGIGTHGFALTAQRAMVVTLFVLLMLRMLFGTSDFGRVMEFFRKNKLIFVLLLSIPLAKVAGNIVTGRLDAGVIGAVINEFFLTIFVVILVVACVTTIRHVIIVVSVVVFTLLINELAVIVEISKGGSLFADALEIDFATRDDRDLLAGRLRSGSYRAMGLFQTSLEMAAFTCLAFPLGVAALGIVRDTGVRTVAALVLVLAGPVIYWTGSRTGLSVYALLVAFYFFRVITRPLNSRFRAVVSFFTIAIVLAAVYFFADEILRYFLTGIERAHLRSAFSRIEQYVFSVPILAESPWFGFGFSRSIVDIIDLENLDGLYLKTAMEGGVIAVTLLMLLFSRTIWELIQIRSKTLDKRITRITEGLAISLTSIMVMGLALSLPSNKFYAFLIIGLTSAMCRIVDRSRDGILEQSPAPQRNLHLIGSSRVD